MKNEASIDAVDFRSYSPLFYASKSGSLKNLNVLLEFSKGKESINKMVTEGNDIETTLKNLDSNSQKTALSLAKTSEAAMLLVEHGATSTNKEFKKHNKAHLKSFPTYYKFLKYHSKSPGYIFDKSIQEINDNLIVFDFDIFKHTKPVYNEMDVHKKVEKEGKPELLLKPIMETFLTLKWNQVKWIFRMNFFLNLLFVISLSTLVSHVFLSLVHCEEEGNSFKTDHGFVFHAINDTHSMMNNTDGMDNSKIFPFVCKKHFLR